MGYQVTNDGKPEAPGVSTPLIDELAEVLREVLEERLCPGSALYKKVAAVLLKHHRARRPDIAKEGAL